MNVIVENGFAVRIPELPARYRANCSKDYGCFVTGETKNLSSRDAEKQGFTKGNFVEMAICWIDKKVLTFEPHYYNESFTEIWGIPVKGEMKNQFPDNASELSTFLIHRQSKDKLAQKIEEFSRDAFKSWINEGMKDDYEEYAVNKANETYFSHIFRFEFVQAESSYGIYHFVKISLRKSENDIENKALAIAKQIYEGQMNGLGYCTDNRLEINQEKSLLALSESKSKSNSDENLQLNEKGKNKILASSKK